MSSAPPPSAPSKKTVLDAAAKLLLQEGFATFTLDRLAAAVGVPTIQLKEFCLSGEELVFQVLSRDVDEVVSTGRTSIQKDVPVMELMRGISEIAGKLVESHPLTMQLLFGTPALAIPDWADRFDELRRRCIRLASDVVAVGIDQKVFRKDLPLDLVAGLLFEIHVAGHLFRPAPGPQPQALRAQQRRTVALEVLFNGLRLRS